MNDCINLESVTFINPLTSIGCNAFSYCDTLKSFDFSKSITICPYAFYYSGVEELKIPPSLNFIQDFAFANSQLKLISFEESNANLALNDSCFYNTQIETFNLNKEIQFTGSKIFACCGKLKNISLNNNKAIPQYFAWFCIELNTVNSKDVIEFGASAFENCINLKQIIRKKMHL